MIRSFKICHSTFLTSVLLLISVFLGACISNPKPIDIKDESFAIEIKDEFFAKVYDWQLSNDNAVWLTSDQGIARFDGQTWMIVAPNQGYREFAIAPDGTFWTYTNTQVIHFDKGIQKTYTPTLEAPLRKIRGIHTSTNGKIWIGAVFTDGTFNPIWSFTGNNWNRTPEIRQDLSSWKEEKPSDFIEVALYAVDGQGRPWIKLSEPDHGMTAYLEDEHWRSEVPNGTLKYMADGSYWGTILEWVYYQDGSTGPGSANSSRRLAGICYYSASISHECYLYGKQRRLSDVTGIAVSSYYRPVRTSPFLTENQVHSFALAADGVLWGIAKNKKLVWFNGTEWQIAGLMPGDHEYHDIEISSNGDIWVLTNQGVGHLYPVKASTP